MWHCVLPNAKDNRIKQSLCACINMTSDTCTHNSGYIKLLIGDLGTLTSASLSAEERTDFAEFQESLMMKCL